MVSTFPRGQTQCPCQAFEYRDPTPLGATQFPRLKATLTLADLDEAEQDDQGQGQEFGGGKGVLHAGGSLHAVAVHSGEQHCGDREQPESSPARWSQHNLVSMVGGCGGQG